MVQLLPNTFVSASLRVSVLKGKLKT